MTIQDFLARLPHEPTKPNGETMCRCPAHADKRHSLSVREGNKGIILKCFAGCEARDIVAALGLKMADLFADEVSARRASKSGSVEARVKTVAPAAPERKQLGKCTATYDYTDADGKLIFLVKRYLDADGEKTFLQCVPDPAAKGGYRWKTSDLPHPLYRLPEVVSAIRDGKPIYVAEGEKDVETLRAIGLTATTHPGGASWSQDPKRQKWQDNHTQALTGVDVIILRDEDVYNEVHPESSYIGQRHAVFVARQLLTVAKRVRILDLTQSGYQIPPKGDVSDLCALCGKDKLPAIITQLAATAPDATEQLLDAMLAQYTPTSPELSGGAPDGEGTEIEQAYAAVKGYCVKDGCICKLTQGSKDDAEPYPRPLCTFTCLPRAEITQDDGVSTTTLHLIDGWDREGHKLPQVRVLTDNFRNMAWVGKAWGFRANLMPGNTVADNLRYAIAEVGYRKSQRVTEYTHTGWRKIDGRWAYLYHGGALGREDVTVDLGDGLSEYTLGGELGAASAKAAAEWSYNIRTVMADHIAVPLLATTYLAPLREALVSAGFVPRYTLYLVGDPKVGKSIGAELAQYHYRAVAEAQFPCGFYDTANRVEGMSFRLKDALLVVDDLHPTSSTQERRKMEDMANRLSRLTPRGRMNADGTSRKVTPPRSLTIVTAEYMPNIGESGVSRCYEVEVRKTDVPKDGRLTAMQEQGQLGTLRRAMRGYIEWLLPQMDSLPQMLSERFRALRAEAQQLLGSDGTRMSETVAMQLLGYEMMMRYMQTLGVVEYIEDEMAYAKRMIVRGGQRQTTATKDERPSRVYLNSVHDLLLARTADVVDLLSKDSQQTPARGMIGYKDSRYYYLNPGLSYAMVCELVRKGGVEFPLSQKPLWKQLAEDGMIHPAVDGSTNTRVRQIDGKPQRLLWVPRQMIDGGEVDAQTRIITSTEGGGGDIAEIQAGEDTPF